MIGALLVFRFGLGRGGLVRALGRILLRFWRRNLTAKHGLGRCGYQNRQRQ